MEALTRSKAALAASDSMGGSETSRSPGPPDGANLVSPEYISSGENSRTKLQNVLADSTASTPRGSSSGTHRRRLRRSTPNLTTRRRSRSCVKSGNISLAVPAAMPCSPRQPRIRLARAEPPRTIVTTDQSGFSRYKGVIKCHVPSLSLELQTSTEDRARFFASDRNCDSVSWNG